MKIVILRINDKEILVIENRDGEYVLRDRCGSSQEVLIVVCKLLGGDLEIAPYPMDRLAQIIGSGTLLPSELVIDRS